MRRKRTAWAKKSNQARVLERLLVLLSPKCQGASPPSNRPGEQCLVTSTVLPPAAPALGSNTMNWQRFQHGRGTCTTRTKERNLPIILVANEGHLS
ncbi:hypothetical protein CSUI_005127, partial [Cystoisospora suis]